MLLTLKPPVNLTRYTSTITRLLISTTKTSTSFSLESRNSKGSRSVVHARSINTSTALESLFTHGYLVSGMLETPCSMYQEAKRVFYSGSSCEKRWRKNSEWPNMMLTSNTPLLWQHFKKLPMQLINEDHTVITSESQMINGAKYINGEGTTPNNASLYIQSLRRHSKYLT